MIDSLERIGKLKLNGITIHPILGMSDPWKYRNKAQVPLGSSREGGMVAGFYATGSHRIIDMKECLIQHDDSNRTVQEVRRMIF